MKYLIFVFTVSLIFLLFTGTNPILLSNSILLQNLFLPISSLFFSSIILFLTFIEIKSKKTKKIAKFCADVSYSMYLFHLFFIYFIGDFANNISLSFLVYISSLMSFCYLFFVLVEKPILDARPKFKKA